jgi:hypothetical protein
MSSPDRRESGFEDRPEELRTPLPSSLQNAAESASLNEDDTVELRPRRWDEDDPQRKDDCFAPPAEPCECYCLHCGRTFMSTGIWFQKVINDPQGFAGFWMCPTPNCSGAGFTFDIFPTDPNHPANEGWHTTDDDEDPEVVGETFDGWDDDAESLDTEYNPAEPQYKELDDMFGSDSDDDMEGEEWKYGLEPGERPSFPPNESARKEWEDQQRRYEETDQRPRELDWSDR